MTAEIILSIEGLRIDARAEDDLGRHSTIVHDVNLVLRRGEVLGLIGESGAGKSTIGLATLGYTKAGCSVAVGQVRFRGMDVLAVTAEERRRLRGRKIAYVAQSAAASFDPTQRIMGQVCEAPLRHSLMSLDQARTEAVELFRQLDLPSPETFGDRYPHQVSGGQLQRAMAAMAMSCRPEILILDEPTTALDVTTQIEVLVSIRKLIREHHTAAIYITHDLAVVAQLADRIVVLRHGRIVEEGDAAQIIEHPKMPYTRRLLSARSGKRIEGSGERQGTRSLLTLQGVSAAYGGAAPVIDDIDLDVGESETVSIVGESGSGKTTLGRVIVGLLPLCAGQMRLDGEILNPSLGKRPRDTLRRIQLIQQMPDVALNPRQKVGDIVGRPLRFYHGLEGAARKKRVAELLQAIELPPELASRYPGELSGGQKQRVCIARALAAEPSVIVCDEVTSALDPVVADEVLNLLQRLQREHGYSYIFITHDLGTVRRLGGRVVVMLRGRIVDEGSYERIFGNPSHPYCEKLLRSVPEMRRGWLEDVISRRPVPGLPDLASRV